ncbi:hypothetical protein SDC9_194267 [bioreactor metagenome]|uniref:Uncharacterized protein n=1 Tax=bioreactor metagenome TaxID=1076179 RepID=A0A645I5T2_9ZZZZ
MEIIFPDVVSRVQDNRIFSFVLQPVKRIGECVDNGLGSQVTSADTHHHYHIAPGAERRCGIFDIPDEVFGN